MNKYLVIILIIFLGLFLFWNYNRETFIEIPCTEGDWKQLLNYTKGKYDEIKNKNPNKFVENFSEYKALIQVLALVSIINAGVCKGSGIESELMSFVDDFNSKYQKYEDTPIMNQLYNYVKSNNYFAIQEFNELSNNKIVQFFRNNIYDNTPTIAYGNSYKPLVFNEYKYQQDPTQLYNSPTMLYDSNPKVYDLVKEEKNVVDVYYNPPVPGPLMLEPSEFYTLDFYNNYASGNSNYNSPNFSSYKGYEKTKFMDKLPMEILDTI